MKLEELEIYNLSLELSYKSWELYQSLDKQYKYHPGDQFIRAIDSIGANIAEGYGRYYYLDTVRFLYNARGSLIESKFWLKISLEIKLISETNYNEVIIKLNRLGVKLNNFINVTRKRGRKLKE
jgi:four helix bundle protein